MIAVIFILDGDIVVASAGRRYETASMVYIYVSIRFANHTLIFEGFIRVGRRCKIVVTVDGVITARFTKFPLSSGMLMYIRLIQVSFGHGYGCRRAVPKGLSRYPREIGEIAIRQCLLQC